MNFAARIGIMRAPAAIQFPMARAPTIRAEDRRRIGIGAHVLPEDAEVGDGVRTVVLLGRMVMEVLMAVPSSSGGESGCPGLEMRTVRHIPTLHCARQYVPPNGTVYLYYKALTNSVDS